MSEDTMTNDKTLDDNTEVEGTGKEVGFHAPSTFADFEAMRPLGDTRMPLRTAVRTGLRNGYKNLYPDVIRPLLDGDISHGNLTANETIIGDRFIQIDIGPDGENLLARARPPKNAGKFGITSQIVGRTIRSILAEGLEFDKRSMIVSGPRERRD